MRLHRTVAAILAALTVAACGSDDEGRGGKRGDAAPTPLAAAVRKADDTRSYRFRYTANSDLDGERFAVQGSGISSDDSMQIRMKMDLREAGETIPVEMILTGGQVFLGGEGYEHALPKGKRWILTGDETFRQQVLTPGEFVEMVRDAKELEDQGRETIRGTPATKLSGPLDLRKMIERVGSGPIYERYKHNPGTLDLLDAEIAVWVDADERILRQKLHATSDKAPGTLDMTVDVLAYDVPLDAADTPSADTMIDEDEVVE